MRITLILILIVSFLLIFSPAVAGGVKQLRQENEALKSQLNSAVSRISENETQIQNLEDQLTLKDRELEKMKEELNALELRVKELEELLRKEGSELLQEVISLRDKKVILEDRIGRLENDIAISNAKIDQLNQLVREYEKSLAEKTDENKNLTLEINNLQRNLEEMKKSLNLQNAEYSKRIAQLSAERDSLKGEVSRLETRVSELVATLSEQGGETSKLIADLTARNKELENGIVALRQNIDSLKKELDARDKQYTKNMDQVLTDKWNMEKQLLLVKGENERLENQLMQVGSEKENLANQISQIESEKKALEDQIAGLRKELDARLAAEEADKERMKKTYEQLLSSLQKEVGEKTIEVQNYQNALTINIMEKIFFDSGKAVIKPEGLDVLRRVGAIIKDLQDKIIRIEGHTDDVPIGPRLASIYPTNWELGAARASNVAEYFRTKAGIEPERLMVVSYSMYRPIVPNTSEENRARNRRIEIILQDKSFYDMVKFVEGE
jgi:chemotaxis protein MotB